jgi:hypothetical protein
MSLQQYKELAVVMSRIVVCKPHSADCERLISAYSLLKSVRRCSLNRQTITDCLYISTNMPPITNYDPRPAVHIWINDKERRFREPTRSERQRFFKNIFRDDECGEVSNEELFPKRKF